MASEWEIFAFSQYQLLFPLSGWIIAEEGPCLDTSLPSPSLFSTAPSCFVFILFFLSLAEGHQLSAFARSYVSFSFYSLSPCFPLRMSCEEAQLHKERLQALAVSQSGFKISLLALFLFWWPPLYVFSACLSVTCLGFHGHCLHLSPCLSDIHSSLLCLLRQSSFNSDSSFSHSFCFTFW